MNYRSVLQLAHRDLPAFLATFLLLLCFSVASCADPERPYHVVVIKTRDNAFYSAAVQGFLHGLKVRGYDGSAQIDVVTLSLTGQSDHDRSAVRSVLQRKWRLIVTLGTDATREAAEADSSTPLLFGMILDPVSLGLVKSLDNPGGRMTGATLLVSPGKQFETLLEAAPQIKHIGVLYTENDPTSLSLLERARSEAKQLNVEILAQPVAAEGKDACGQALNQLKGKVDALWLIPDPASTASQNVLETFDFAKAQNLPVLGDSSGTVKAGALLALSANLQDMGDVMAEMSTYLLTGSGAAAEMRVRGPRQTLLSINLQSARALNLKIPDTVLRMADEVVDDTEGK